MLESAPRKGMPATQPRSEELCDKQVETLSPPLKWAGGKRWQIPFLRTLWQKQRNRRLVEPFCGGLAVTLGLVPQRALLNDLNPHVINFYRWLQRGLKISIELRPTKTQFYANRN